VTTYTLVGTTQGFGSIESVVDPTRIAQQIGDISSQLGSVFTTPLGLPLKSMEVALTITAEGAIGFLGTGAKASAEGSITLTFERADPKA
jgi:hypothetical protein